MEGFYLACKIRPYSPIRLAEVGATGDSHPASRDRSYEGSRSTGSRGGDAIQGIPIRLAEAGVTREAGAPGAEIHLRLEILSSQYSSSASVHGQDDATVNVQISRSSETLATQYTEGYSTSTILLGYFSGVYTKWLTSTWCIQGNNTSSSSEYSDEGAARPALGTNEYFNEMIYCTCNRCQNRKLKKRRLVGIHRLNYGVYIEELLPVHNIPKEPTDVTDDSHSQDEEQDMVMDEATSQINEAGVDEFIKDFYTSFEEVIDSPLAQLARTPVFSNADTSILATLMLLLNLKVTHGLTNTCFTDILRLLANKILPKDDKLPHSHREDEDHDEFIEVFEGHEQPHGHQVHEDDEFIDFNLPVVEGDEDHENSSINLFVDLGPITDEVFMPSNEEISSEDDIV
ncbi:hypothetical protein SUGI_0251560 [Cryptomeria japonica]|nr:hypothetical protein SUGI_0251560 [Cryptomeria japonica]